MVDIQNVPASFWVGVSALAGGLGYSIRALLGLEKKVKEIIQEQCFTKVQADERFAHQKSCDNSRSDCRLLRADKTEVAAAEREAVHTARNEMSIALGAHVTAGHPQTMERLAKIDTLLALIQERQGSMVERQEQHGAVLESHGKLLEEIRVAVRKS